MAYYKHKKSGDLIKLTEKALEARGAKDYELAGQTLREISAAQPKPKTTKRGKN